MEDLEVVAVAAAFVVQGGVAVGFFFEVVSVAVVAGEVFAAVLVFAVPGPGVPLAIAYL